MAESKELDTRGGHTVTHQRDPHAEPSVEWGWHGSFPRTTRIGGWSLVALLLLMLIGNHEGRVEDLWLVGLAVTVAIALVWDQVQRRTSWRR